MFYGLFEINTIYVKCYFIYWVQLPPDLNFQWKLRLLKKIHKHRIGVLIDTQEIKGMVTKISKMAYLHSADVHRCRINLPICPKLSLKWGVSF